MDIKRIASPEIAPHFNGWGAMLMLTGTGGIPAESGGTAGTASDVQLCMVKNDGTIVPTGSTFTVFNPRPDEIEGDTYISVTLVNGTQLVAIDLTAPGGGGDPGPDPDGDVDCDAVRACFEPRCCEHSADDRCMYKPEAIVRVNLDDGGGGEWTQAGKSSFHGDDCKWKVPMADPLCVKTEAIVERTATGWKVTHDGDVWESTGGVTECTGEDGTLDDGAIGGGLVGWEHEGNCPTSGCCEDLPGSIVPRVTITGAPSFHEYEYNAVSNPGIVNCANAPIFINRVTIDASGSNGVFHGPPMIENPAGPEYGMVWPDSITVCQEIDFVTRYYKNGVLQCEDRGNPCDAVNPGLNASYSWSQNPATGVLTFNGVYGALEGIIAGDACNAFKGGPFAHGFPAMSCAAGATWRDYKVEYTDTVRMKFFQDPDTATYICWPITVVCDFVEA